ncbi:MAG: 16S rRNA (guanine(527)-N(7))-methyltransferase RsmG [Desulfobulbales bacterium]
MLTGSEAEKFLAQGLDRMGLFLADQPAALGRLYRYFQELKKWNRKINLVARSLEDRQILESHFLDSLTLVSLLPPHVWGQETILDVGTGAGFPGLLLKAACPELAVTLIEPRQNRFYFLKHIARILQLQEVDVLDVRLDEKSRARELAGHKFSLITSRAFTDICRFIRLTSPYLAKGGQIVLMKGPGVGDELQEFARGDIPGDFHVAAMREFTLPFSGRERLLLSIRRSEPRS